MLSGELEGPRPPPEKKKENGTNASGGPASPALRDPERLMHNGVRDFLCKGIWGLWGSGGGVASICRMFMPCR